MHVKCDGEISCFLCTFFTRVGLVVIFTVEFHECHIRGAVNVTFPAIMVRRIAAGKIDLFEKSKELKAKVGNNRMTFVVYDSYLPGTADGSGPELSDLVTLVAKKLAQSGCRVATLKGQSCNIYINSTTYIPSYIFIFP